MRNIEIKKILLLLDLRKLKRDGAVWDTDYVMNFQDMKMSIRLDRSYLEEALTIDPKFFDTTFYYVVN